MRVDRIGGEGRARELADLATLDRQHHLIHALAGKVRHEPFFFN